MVAVDKDVKTQVAVTDDATRMSSKMQVAITDDFEFDDYDMSDSSGVVSDNTFETIKHLFFTKKKIGIGFEELEDGSWGIESVHAGTQAEGNKVKVGSTLVSINGKPCPAGADALAKFFKRCMRKQTMMLEFAEKSSLFRRRRRPSLNLYQFDVDGGSECTAGGSESSGTRSGGGKMKAEQQQKSKQKSKGRRSKK